MRVHPNNCNDQQHDTAGWLTPRERAFADSVHVIAFVLHGRPVELCDRVGDDGARAFWCATEYTPVNMLVCSAVTSLVDSERSLEALAAAIISDLTLCFAGAADANSFKISAPSRQLAPHQPVALR